MDYEVYQGASFFRLGENMPHDIEGLVHWHEPTGEQRAAYGEYEYPQLTYDYFMEIEGIL